MDIKKKKIKGGRKKRRKKKNKNVDSLSRIAYGFYSHPYTIHYHTTQIQLQSCQSCQVRSECLTCTFRRKKGGGSKGGTGCTGGYKGVRAVRPNYSHLTSYKYQITRQADRRVHNNLKVSLPTLVIS